MYSLDTTPGIRGSTEIRNHKHIDHVIVFDSIRCHILLRICMISDTCVIVI